MFGGRGGGEGGGGGVFDSGGETTRGVLGVGDALFWVVDFFVEFVSGFYNIFFSFFIYFLFYLFVRFIEELKFVNYFLFLLLVGWRSIRNNHHKIVR